MLKTLVVNRRNLQDLLKFSHKRCVSYFSTQTALQPDEGTQKDLLRSTERLSRIKIKTRTKKPQKPPFVKNIFAGVYDTDILSYPQLEKEELEELNKSIKPVEDAFSSQGNVSKNGYLEQIKQLQLSGLQVSQLLGGRELTLTESNKFNEIVYSDSSLALNLISNEHFGIQALVRFGNEDQRNRYLSLLTDSKISSTFCIVEQKIQDPNFLETSAVLSADKKYWTINGEKAWVINADSSDLLVVIAKTESLSHAGLKECRTTAFLVEKDFGGISLEPCQPLGIDGTNVSHVKFENTPVPVENVLGSVNEGNVLVSKLLAEIRIGMGVACVSLTRKVLNKLVEYTSQTSNGVMCLAETDLRSLKIGKIATWLYAMESTLYLTSLLQDHYENQDCDLEAAIVKVLGSNLAHKSTLETMDFIGVSTYMKDHWINGLHNDALAFRLLHETNDSLKIIIALMGLQYAGIKLNDKIKMIRNPLFHPAAMFKRMWEQRRQIEDNPRLTLKLAEYLHPSLSAPALWLEYCVFRLQFATEIVFSRYGPDVMNKHMELKRLADCAIDIYAMTACLGRASRSYCIGLRNADAEIRLASTFCLEAKERVKSNVNRIWVGPFVSNDESYTKLAKLLFTTGKYFAEHPLARNF